jgi:hypothetical protein
MVHQRESLTLGLEAGDDLLRVQTRLDDFQRHAPPHRSALVRHPHRAESALANLLEQFVITDDVARLLAGHPGRPGGIRAGDSIAEEFRRSLVSGELCLNAGTQIWISGANFIEKCRPLLGRNQLAGVQKQVIEA